jgi:DNA-binding transcriptional MerR regulator
MASRGNTHTETRGNWQGKALGPGEYLRSTLAVEVGVSVDTIRRWQEDGFLIPIRREPGKRGQYVFDDSALQIAKRFKELQHRIKDVRLVMLAAEYPQEFADWISNQEMG